jgi:hypothetical protein
VAIWKSFLPAGLANIVEAVRKPRPLAGFVDILDRERIAGWAAIGNPAKG